jgi:hypothetical protein
MLILLNLRTKGALMKSQKTIPDKSNVISTVKMEHSNTDRLKEFSLAIGLVIFGIGFSLLPNPVKAGTEDIQRYYRYVPYEGPGASAGKPAQQPGKQVSGASGTEAKKTEQAPSQAGKPETAAPPSTGESAPVTSAGPEATGTAGQEAVPCPHSQQPGAKAESSMSGEQKSSAEQKYNPVGKPSRDTGEFPSGDIPSFCQVDVNKDHYVTKDELQNFPDLLKVFDKVDAGKDGRLEQHEFQNLEMETKREGEIM